MRNTYIARTKDGRLHSFYHTPENGVSRRVYENGRWQRAAALALDAREDFSVSLGADGKFYIFFTDRDGNLKLCTEQGQGGFAVRTLPDIGGRGNGAFYAVVSNKGTSLVYDIHDTEEDADYIVSSRLLNNGLFSQPQKIDKFSKFSDGAFLLQVAGDDHALLFYQVKKPETILGYREITIDRTGGFNAFHITNGPVYDYSFLTAPDSIHFLYIIRNMFASSLVYRRRHEDGLTAAVTVAEGQGLGKCLLFILNGTLHACFMVNGALYTSVSENGGASFGKPERYRSKLCENPEKAVFLSEEALDPERFCAREVFVDRHNPWDVQIMPDLFDEFYPAPVFKAPVNQKESPKEVPKEAPKEKEQSEAELYYGADGDEALKLRNRVEALEKQLAEKDRQLLNYASGARDESGEHTAAIMDWRAKHDKLSKENTMLSREIQNQKNVIEMLYREKEERDKSIQKEKAESLEE